jgi:hypothetical protein
MDRYLKELIESRQSSGDGTVVSFGDSTHRADVYWSNDGECWVIVDRSDPARPKAHRADEIALVQLDPDVGCAIYTRKSTEEGLDKDFNSLDAQREAAEAFIKSQAHEGWRCLPRRYDDGGFTGGNMDRPALKRLLADIAAGEIDVVVTYKVDRLSRSLLDFARIIQLFDDHGVSFASSDSRESLRESAGKRRTANGTRFLQFFLVD